MTWTVCSLIMPRALVRPKAMMTYFASKVTTQENTMKKIETVTNRDGKTFKVGDFVTLKKTITVEDVDKFCELSGDFNTIHTQSRIVHGALLNGLVSGVIGTKIPGPGTMVVSQTLNYPLSCVAPQNITITVSLTKARKIICCDFECRSDEGMVVLRGDAKLVITKK